MTDDTKTLGVADRLQHKDTVVDVYAPIVVGTNLTVIPRAEWMKIDRKENVSLKDPSALSIGAALRWMM